MDLDVLFVGTAGSAPSARRGLPATLVRRGGDRLLFDCGEGTQRQLVRSTGLVELEEIFITHFHADHVLGLPGMLKTFALRQRERPLTVYGPRGLRGLFDALQPIVGRLTFPVGLEELAPNDELERDGYRIAAYATDHGVGALGYALVEDARPGAFDPERARSLGVTPGPDFGRLQDGETVNGVAPDRRHGRAAARPAARARRRHRPVRDDPPGRLRGRPADPRGDLPGRGGRSRRRDAPLDRPPGGRAGRRRGGDDARAHARVAALRRRARCARRRARASRTRSSRATSTASRSPSPSAASRCS